MQSVEGIVVDVGWYRTTIRSFEREIYNIPNSVFSRNVVLNVTRKQREWRFFDFIGKPSSPLFHGCILAWKLLQLCLILKQSCLSKSRDKFLTFKWQQGPQRTDCLCLSYLAFLSTSAADMVQPKSGLLIDCLKSRHSCRNPSPRHAKGWQCDR